MFCSHKLEQYVYYIHIQQPKGSIPTIIVRDSVCFWGVPLFWAHHRHNKPSRQAMPTSNVHIAKQLHPDQGCICTSMLSSESSGSPDRLLMEIHILLALQTNDVDPYILGSPGCWGRSRYYGYPGCWGRTIFSCSWCCERRYTCSCCYCWGRATSCAYDTILALKNVSASVPWPSLELCQHWIYHDGWPLLWGLDWWIW